MIREETIITGSKFQMKIVDQIARAVIRKGQKVRVNPGSMKIQVRALKIIKRRKIIKITAKLNIKRI